MTKTIESLDKTISRIETDIEFYKALKEEGLDRSRFTFRFITIKLLYGLMKH